MRNQSTRLVNSGQTDREALTLLKAEDIPDDFGPGFDTILSTKSAASRILPRGA